MHRFLYFSLVVIVVTLVLGIVDKERRRMWLGLLATVTGALVALVLVAWLVFESEIW
jgi:asparagine N-glycosylation enzyme membrane subunit Stt3